MELLRSLIFVPGNRRDMLEKARDFDTDVLVPDLEDSVPPGEKQNARRLVQELASSLSRRGQKVVVRVNSLETGLAQDDISAVIGPYLYGISVGKVESTWDIKDYDKIVTLLEKGAGLEQGHVKFIPWIENSRAVMRAYDIASASSRVVALAFGAEDYTDDMEVQRTDGGEEVYFARATVAVASRAARVVALDSPFVGYRDSIGLKQDIDTALHLGFKGKFAIHPAQLDHINTLFSPVEEDVSYARRVVAAWDEAEASGRGSTSVDGRMIDVPVVKRARSLLDLADAIADRK